MPHSKTPGGQQASDKFMKQEAQSALPLNVSSTTPTHHASRTRSGRSQRRAKEARRRAGRIGFWEVKRGHRQLCHQPAWREGHWWSRSLIVLDPRCSRLAAFHRVAEQHITSHHTSTCRSTQPFQKSINLDGHVFNLFNNGSFYRDRYRQLRVR